MHLGSITVRQENIPHRNKCLSQPSAPPRTAPTIPPSSPILSPSPPSGRIRQCRRGRKHRTRSLPYLHCPCTLAGSKCCRSPSPSGQEVPASDVSNALGRPGRSIRKPGESICSPASVSVLEKDGRLGVETGELGFLIAPASPMLLLLHWLFYEDDKEAEYYRIKALEGEMTLFKKNDLKETWTGRGKIYKSRARAAWLFEKMLKSWTTVLGVFQKPCLRAMTSYRWIKTRLFYLYWLESSKPGPGFIWLMMLGSWQGPPPSLESAESATWLSR
jgi:hypothetical protein